MVQKEWIAVKCEQVSSGRRNSLLTGRSPMQPDTHKRRRRSHHGHHHHHHHRSSSGKHHREDRKPKDNREGDTPAIQEDINADKPIIVLPQPRQSESESQDSDQDSTKDKTETGSDNTDKDRNGVIDVIHKLNVTAYEF